MADTPRVEQLAIPPEYGSPSHLLSWDAVDTRLAEALHYWLATVRPDGRPHAVPLDGLWLDAKWYFGGSPRTVKHRNLLANPRATLHLEDAASAVIVEGACQVITPDAETAEHLSQSSRAKYGYGPSPSVYLEGVWQLQPTRVMAWTDLTSDPTRFLFS
jgi:nitroimidazol reductase NimA-like FMN-containing flavoprotein (pyridoxamine 5'-phosphate oxidase superfamily)